MSSYHFGTYYLLHFYIEEGEGTKDSVKLSKKQRIKKSLSKDSYKSSIGNDNKKRKKQEDSKYNIDNVIFTTNTKPILFTTAPKTMIEIPEFKSLADDFYTVKLSVFVFYNCLGYD